MEPSLYFLASLVVRVTAVLAVALLLVRMGRSLASSLRYEAVVMAMVASLVLPLLMLLVPSWNVLPSIPDSWNLAEAVRTMQNPAETPAPASATLEERHSSSIAADNPVGEAVAFGARTMRSLSLFQILLLGWGFGAVVILMRSLQARLTLSRWWKGAQSVDAAVWDDVVEEAGDRVFLTRHVELRQMAGISSPMTWGLWKPRLLMPEEASLWARERKLNAVMHEFVHVRRRDAWHDLMSVLFVSLFWFHPMAWMLRQQLWVQREASCDDSVLQLGANPQEYAQMLIDVAKEMRGIRGVPQVAMTISRPSQLEGRILSVLDTNMSKRVSRPAQQRVVAAGWVALAVFVAAMSPAPGNEREGSGVFESQKEAAWNEVSSEVNPQPPEQESLVKGLDVSQSAGEEHMSARDPLYQGMDGDSEEVNLDTTVEDFLAIAGMRMADAALSELGRSMSEVDWNAWLEKSGIKVSDLGITIADGDTENMSFDAAMDEMGAAIQTAVITEMEKVIRENPGTEKARRAVQALIEIDSPAAREALDRLDIHRLPR